MIWLIIISGLVTMKIMMKSAAKEVDEEMKRDIEAAGKLEPFFKRYERWKEADKIIEKCFWEEAE